MPPDEQRGRVREVVPRRVRQHRRHGRQSCRVDALRVVDPRRSRAADDPDRRGPPLGRRRAGGVAACLGDPRPRGDALRRARARRLPARPPISEGERMTDRVARLREQLEEPLLVTTPKNVLYLVGFDSSNAVLLVDDERVELFTDFRYIQAARAVEGVEAVQTRRAVLAELAERLSGRLAFEASTLTYEQYQTLERGGLELVPRSGLVEGLRAVKDERELEAIRRACAITDRVFERLTKVPFVGRSERDVSWDLTALFHDEGAESMAFEHIVGAGPTASGTGSASTCTSCRACRRRRATSSSRGTSSRSSRASTSTGASASESRTTSSSPRTASRT